MAAVALSAVYLDDRARVLGELRELRALLPAAVPLIAGGSAAGALAASAGPAAAYVPDARLVEGVEQTYLELFWGDRDMWRSTFQTASPDPDGIPGPDGTPDGRGAFQWFHGPSGSGAVYSHFGNGGAVISGIVYGDILASWSAHGWENGFGYPEGAEHDATASDIANGCRPGDRAQTFVRSITDVRLESKSGGRSGEWRREEK